MNKFLICDNDNDFLELIDIFLRSKGYEFIKVDKGKMVFDTLKENDIRLLLLDLNLPDMHGTQIIEQIRNDPETKDTKIILLSGMLCVDNNLKQMGVDDYIEKPFDLKDLEEKIDKNLFLDR